MTTPLSATLFCAVMASTSAHELCEAVNFVRIKVLAK